MLTLDPDDKEAQAAVVRLGGALPSDSAWVRTELWRCPGDGAVAFQRLVTTHWAPVFDAVVQEGLFTSWSVGQPVQERTVDFDGGESILVPDSPTWDWIASWEAPSRRVYETSWPEYHRRLADRPDVPDPATFCTRVRIVQHGVSRRI